MMPTWMSGHSRLSNQNKRSTKQEKEVAKQNGGRVQAGSGNTWKNPRDVKTPEKLIECKYTDGARYSLSAIAWNDYKKTALQAGREPELIIEFSNYKLNLRVTEV